jgi:hypothetical protein
LLCVECCATTVLIVLLVMCGVLCNYCVNCASCYVWSVVQILC